MTHSSPIIIRDARPKDAEMAAAVHMDTWRTAYRGIVAQEFLDGLSYAKRREGFLKGLADPHTITVVAEAEGKIVGFARAAWINTRTPRPGGSGTRARSP